VDRAAALVDLGDLADDEGDAWVEQPSLGTLQVRSPLTAHGDVHEARLVDVVPGLVDDGDRDLAGLQSRPQPFDEQVGRQRPADAAAQDQDPVHGVPQWVFSTTISS
jgi:hypothetical protein